MSAPSIRVDEVPVRGRLTLERAPHGRLLARGLSRRRLGEEVQHETHEGRCWPTAGGNSAFIPSASAAATSARAICCGGSWARRRRPTSYSPAATSTRTGLSGSASCRRWCPRANSPRRPSPISTRCRHSPGARVDEGLLQREPRRAELRGRAGTREPQPGPARPDDRFQEGLDAFAAKRRPNFKGS